MTAIYSTGTVTLTNGSAAVVGTGTGWAVSLVKGGTLNVEAAGNPIPIASVTDDTHLTGAVKWTGSSGTYAYAIVRESSDAASIVDVYDRMSRLLVTLSLAGITPNASGTIADRDAITLTTNDEGFLFLHAEIGVAFAFYRWTGTAWDGPFPVADAADGGGVTSIVAGTGVTVDSTNPAIPAISADIPVISAALRTAQTHNRIVNPAMQISQENGSTAGTALGYYAADQWQMVQITSGVLTLYRPAATTPKGSRYRLQLAVTTADTSIAADEVALISQNIEGSRLADFGWGQSWARQAVLRFGFRTNVPGTYCASIRSGNSTNDPSFVSNFTISAGQANVETEQVIVIPPMTTGTWPIDNTGGAVVAVCVASGTTYQGVPGWQTGNKVATSSISNGLAVASKYFDVFDVGLYLDPQNTGVAPPWQMPDEAQELAACMRYWLKYSSLVVETSIASQSTTFSTTMRVPPAVTGGGAGFVATQVTEQSAQFFQTTRDYQTLVLDARL